MEEEKIEIICLYCMLIGCISLMIVGIILGLLGLIEVIFV